jgi:hypothetical protein
MFRTLTIGTVSVAAVASSVPALAQQDQFGTATEAKVMLETNDGDNMPQTYRALVKEALAWSSEFEDSDRFVKAYLEWRLRAKRTLAAEQKEESDA